MTAAEWDTAEIPSRMLRAYPAPWDRRKVRLFWAACHRRSFFSGADAQVRLLAALIENDPDGHGPRLAAEVEAARRRLQSVGTPIDHPEYESLSLFHTSPPAALGALLARLAARAVDRSAWRFEFDPRDEHARHGREADEQKRQCDLIREVFGNPFRPVDFAPWRTATAVAMARDLYDHREYSGMPILADALQDAGCEDEHVLSHCRDAGGGSPDGTGHVRGCWVLDGLLGQ
jgi:hypothetical protein